MLLNEAKEILKKNGYKLLEDTDDWDESDLGIDSYADEKERKKTMKIHNKGEWNNPYSWHYRDLPTKVNHASFVSGLDAENKVLEALKKEFTVRVNKNQECGIKGKLSYSGVVLKFKIVSHSEFTSKYEKNKNNFKTNSNIVSVYLDETDYFDNVFKIVDTNKPKEIDELIDEIIDYINK